LHCGRASLAFQNKGFPSISLKARVPKKFYSFKQALKIALEVPNFKEFADYILQVATREGVPNKNELGLADDLRRM
jgi:hypothetical protein